MTAIAVIDVVVGPGVGFLPLLSLGPALAAVSWRSGHTALIGGAALVLCALLAQYDSFGGSRREFIALATICGVTAAGVVASAGRHRREQELAGVRAVAEAAQHVVLRPVPGDVSPVRAAVRYISATASARIGGDLYEVVTAGGYVRLILGDAQGKGLPAVQTAAAVLGAFREAAYDAIDLAEIAMRVERSLQRQADDEEFVTAVLAQIPVDGRRIEILNCGHPPPLMLSGTAARFIEPPDPGLPLGLAELAGTRRDPVTLPFGPSDQILFYTDGVSEARDRSGGFYPLERCPVLLDGQDPGTALDRLHDDVIRHVGHALLDDAAMLLIRRQPSMQDTASDADSAVSSRSQHKPAHVPGNGMQPGSVSR
ncbi:MAG: PP2C family protein-serine/threonine phosphatase [Micromonosporaceae bacterium]